MKDKKLTNKEKVENLTYEMLAILDSQIEQGQYNGKHLIRLEYVIYKLHELEKKIED